MCHIVILSRSLVVRLVVSILLYGCENWTLTADLERRRIQAFERTCYRKFLRISYTEHRTKEFVKQQVTNFSERQERLVSTVRRRKLAWYDHISRQDSLAKIILQSTVEGKTQRQTNEILVGQY